MLRLVGISIRSYRQGLIQRSIHSSAFMRSQDSDGLKKVHTNGTDLRMKSLETQMEHTRTEVKNIRMDIKIFTEQVTHKFEMTALQSKQQFQALTADIQKQSDQYFSRAFFGTLGIAGLLIGGAWVLPMKENERLDAEINKILKERQIA